MFIVFASLVEGNASVLLEEWLKTRPGGGKDLQTWASTGVAMACECRGGSAIAFTSDMVGIGSAVHDADSECAGSPISSEGPAALRHIMQLVRRGTLASFKGECSAAVWNEARGELTAVRDPLGVRPLYYSVESSRVVVSDRLEWISMRHCVDMDFVADFVGDGASSERTIWAGVHQLQSGHHLRWSARGWRKSRYWSVPQFGTVPITASEAAYEFRRLMRASVRSRMAGGCETWAHLSGGLDSSTVVAMAILIGADRGNQPELGGTVTFRHSLPYGDETSFSNELVRRYGVKNVLVENYWPWKEDEDPAPATDAPSRDYPFFARDRQMERVVAKAGGTVVLSGAGGDQLFPILPLHVMDLIVNGRRREALSELYRWATERHNRRFWQVLRQYLSMLMFPSRHRSTALAVAPRWLTKSAAEHYECRRQKVAQNSAPPTRGSFYASHATDQLASFSQLPTWLTVDKVRIRHPYAYVPLVEFVLSLPAALRTSPVETKPLVRSAMNGILPERIRARRTKSGAHGPLICFALEKERRFVSHLLRRSVLADHGVIDPRLVAASLTEAITGRGRDLMELFAVLSLETWLQARASHAARP
jgi:asparagine synthase (glutamine-hydrolysing)